jgi:hypothetical protein
MMKRLISAAVRIGFTLTDITHPLILFRSPDIGIAKCFDERKTAAPHDRKFAARPRSPTAN